MAVVPFALEYTNITADVVAVTMEDAAITMEDEVVFNLDVTNCIKCSKNDDLSMMARA